MVRLFEGNAPTTLAEFVERADRHYHTTRERTGEYRIGQAYSNFHGHYFPESASRIIATNTDPFYNDGNLRRFLFWIVENGDVSA